MKETVKIFEESTMVGGWALAVRDDWSYKIKMYDIRSQAQWQLTINEFMSRTPIKYTIQ